MLARRAPVSGSGWICNACRSHARYQAASSLRSYSTAATRQRPIHLAVIGSGPAGYYTAYRLLKKLPDARIDMFESLPVPYGLVRYGVAPDHPEVKKSAETLMTVSEHPHFNFAGNVPIGTAPGHLPLTALAPHYDAVLFAYGASKDRKLNVPGEDLKGVISARAFVGWYNGLPEYADLNPDLKGGDTAVVIGQGNVALDVTRILLSPLEQLRKTDLTENAVQTLSESNVKNVKIIGRRGPLQAPYTIKELRELLHMPTLGFAPPPEGWDRLMSIERRRLPRQLKRIAELLEKGSKTPMSEAEKAWQLGYLRAPAAFLSNDNTNLQAVGFEQQEYDVDPSSLITGDAPTDLNAVRGLRVRSTGTKSLIHAHLAFRSVGYQSAPLDGMEDIGVPFDTARGIIPNDRWGRIISPSEGPASPLTAGHVPGMYCAGWVKRGPTGVIASTMDDAFTTGDIIAKDWEEGTKFIPEENSGEKGETAGSKGGWRAVKREIQKRGIRSVSWYDWTKIDAEERRRGALRGKEREKIRGVSEMLAVLDGYGRTSYENWGDRSKGH